MIKGVYYFEVGKMDAESVEYRKKIKSKHNRNYRKKKPYFWIANITDLCLFNYASYTEKLWGIFFVKYFYLYFDY